jgi:hypothetical protein
VENNCLLEDSPANDLYRTLYEDVGVTKKSMRETQQIGVKGHLRRKKRREETYIIVMPSLGSLFLIYHI